MIKCSTCGASLNEGTPFCAFCGARQGAAPSGGPPPQAWVPQSTGMSPSLAGALAYPMGLITGLFFLWRYPYNRDPFVRFHAFQSIFLSAFYMLFFMAWGAVFGTLFVNLGFLWRMIVPVGSLLRLSLFPLSLFLMYKAWRYERFSLPFIGPLAAKLAG